MPSEPNPMLPPSNFDLALDTIQTRLGLRFDDPALLRQALTHRSYVNENKRKQPDLKNNERLEFLGDAIIEFTASAWLYAQFPHDKEGELTHLRTALVRTETLARFAQECGLAAALRLGRSEDENGGRERLSLLCNSFEALIGALYLDQGIEATQHILGGFFEETFAQRSPQSVLKDPKSRLQEYTLTLEPDLMPSYHTLHEVGPLHDSRFLVELRLRGEPIGWGIGQTKRLAEQAAAQMALVQLDL